MPKQSPDQFSDGWSNDVRELAGKIAAAITTTTGPARSMSLFVKNLSALDSGDAAVVGEKLQAELARTGLTVATRESADVAITVTLSEAVDGYVWVAEVRTRTGSKVVVTRPKALPKSDTPVRQSVVLSESDVVSSAEPVLDFSLTSGSDGRPLLLLLHADRIELLGRKDNSWSSLTSAAIHHSRSWPRDLRGLIDTSSPNQFQIFLPDTLCTGSATPSLSAECRDADNAAWPVVKPLKSISLVSSRNYFMTSNFTGNLPMSNMPAFYAFAADAADLQPETILGGVDGASLLVAENGSATSISANWGDEISSISLSCAAGWYVLADAPGDWTQTDRLQAFRIATSSAVPIGYSLDLAGPVVALWPSKDGKVVRVVWRNLETGMYETSMVSASCGN